MKQIIIFLKKVLTHNYCDTCGFTKEEIYLTEILTEAGIIQCKNCTMKHLKTNKI
jgi:hypothetical protein